MMTRTHHILIACVKRIEAAIKDDSQRFGFAKAKAPEPEGLFDEPI